MKYTKSLVANSGEGNLAEYRQIKSIRRTKNVLSNVHVYLVVLMSVVQFNCMHDTVHALIHAALINKCFGMLPKKKKLAAQRQYVLGIDSPN